MAASKGSFTVGPSYTYNVSDGCIFKTYPFAGSFKIAKTIFEPVESGHKVMVSYSLGP